MRFAVGQDAPQSLFHNGCQRCVFPLRNPARRLQQEIVNLYGYFTGYRTGYYYR